MDTTLPRSRPKSRQSLAHVPSLRGGAGDKENATADVSALQRNAEALKLEKKKSRGKSLGPGGLEALTQTSGNASKLPEIQIKSILKPTVPLTPPKAIPSFDELRRRGTTSQSKPATGNGADELLIDFSTPAPSRANISSHIPMSGSEIVADPFSPIRNKSPKGKVVAVRSEEEQQHAAREREAESKRQEEKQAILQQRAARRKSMANRRVSFAPEATLHTWSVMEMAEDSTTSSASNSTRRQSSMSAQSPLPQSTPATSAPTAEHPEVLQVKASPKHRADGHQNKRRRRSSGLAAIDFDTSAEETFSSSPTGDTDEVDADSSPIRIEDSIHSDDDDTEDDGDTAMSMDDTARSMASADSASTQSSLDERLRRAANLAGTRGIDYDENGDDLSMELATETVTNAFQPWARRTTLNPAQELSALQDQENINPFSPAFKAQPIAYNTAEEVEDEEQDMTMEMTKAVGSILSNNASPNNTRRKSVGSSRRRSSVGRRRSSVDESSLGDETMDFTTVAGGILQGNGATHGNETVAMSDEDMTMEFTSVLGGVVGNIPAGRRESIQSAAADENETMEMTLAVGGILATIDERTEPLTDVEDDETAEMDMTRAAGTILPSPLDPQGRMKARQLMQMESDGQVISSISQLDEPPIDPQLTTPSKQFQHVTVSVASETGSPSLTPKLRQTRRSAGSSVSTTPRTTPNRQPSSFLKQATPTKQMTPAAGRAETPNKTPIIANVTHRGASPKKLFKAEIKARASPASTSKSPAKSRNAVFDIDEKTGNHTPSVILHAPKPHQHMRRRSSGLGIDRDGMGSPRVSELLSRRSSIGDAAPAFMSIGLEPRALRFEDPKAMKDELDAERTEEERRESGRFIMEQEADQQQEENATLQLREMIESMTPKKSNPGKLRGRKSLAPGGARGLLGKRPAELDMDDEDADVTPKRLKVVSREGSPVKKVHLPKPPSKDETTGRIVTGKTAIKSSSNATPTTLASPGKRSVASSPQHTGRFKDLPLQDAASRPASFEDKLDNVMGAIDVSTAKLENNKLPEAEDEKISLQSFLNMTNIHFIELSTTKRRHTIAPNEPSRQSEEGVEESLEACFTAAATTLPLLELYQHATRELKSYISGGRKIIRSIEAETLANQPPLFREYVDARSDVKIVMDNQFRNGKSNARLQSKQGWYEWRGQLVEGLRRGLEGIKHGMEEDVTKLDEQQKILSTSIPELNTEHDELIRQIAVMEQQAEELEAVDHEALLSTRLQLKKADQEFAEKLALLEKLQDQMQEKESALAAAEELKVEMKDQIAEADRVRQECQGLAMHDVLVLKSKIEAIENETGWQLVSAEEDLDEPSEFGVALTMTYKKQLRLFFYPAAFQAPSGRRQSGRKSKSLSGPTAPISLTYSPVDEGEAAQFAMPTERRFFVQLIRSQLQAFSMMPRDSVSARTLLETVSNGWEMASKVANEIRMLNMAGITTAAILGDEKLGANIMLMLDRQSRVNFQFVLAVSLRADGTIYATSSTSAIAGYGHISDLINGPKSRKVETALSKEIENRELGTGAWINAIRGFEQWAQNQLLKPAEKAKEVPTTVVEPSTARTPARTLSTSVGPSTAKRSPLTAKKSNIAVQKRSIPVPTGQQTKIQERTQLQQQREREKEKEKEKENLPPPGAEESTWKAAIPPEMQEAMMHTPVKRVGALRRSPIGGGAAGGI